MRTFAGREGFDHSLGHSPRLGGVAYGSVDLDGVNVHYAEAGDGPALLLVHGVAGSHAIWWDNILPLAEAGFRVLAPDLPGHGDSDKPKAISYDPNAGAALLGRFLIAMDVDKAVVIGNSAGGLMSALFALDQPHRVERLVLVAAGGMGRDVTWFLRLASLPVLGGLAYQPGLATIGSMDRKMLFHKPPPFADEFLSELHRVQGLPGSRQAALRSIRSGVNFSGLRKERLILDKLSSLEVPVLTIWGENDRVLPVEHASAVRRALPSSQLVIYPECGHWPQMEKSGEFNQLVTRFVQGEIDREPEPPKR